MNHKLAVVAEQEAHKNYHGYVCGTEANLKPLIEMFPAWDMRKWDNHWCAAFVYYCCMQAGFVLPVKYPDERIGCNFAGCVAWEQWAGLPEVDRLTEYQEGMELAEGDVVLFDSISDGMIQDQIAIVLKDLGDRVVLAEGNFNNVSAVVTRKKNNHIRAVINMEER